MRIYFFFIFIITIILYSLLSLNLVDSVQGDMYYIIYVHVPIAWVTFTTLYVVAIFSFVLTIKQLKNYKWIVKYATEKIIVLSLLTLITGSFWGHVAWGTWWVWDPKLTSVLIITIYLFVIIIFFKPHNYYGEKLLIIGSILYPFGKYATSLWHSIHQGSSLSVVNTKLSFSIFTGISLASVLLLSIIVCQFLFFYKQKLLESKLIQLN